MAQTRSLSRRNAIAGLGAGSLGFFASHVAGAAAPEQASALTGHALTGLWLAHIALSPDDDTTAAIPAFFGADGSAVLVYPCAGTTDDGPQIRGLALGTWAPIDDREARFTAVQTCFATDGTYRGTRTYDSYPIISDDGTSFTVKGEFDLLTVRDAANAIVESRQGAARSPMVGFRMTPGNVGFLPGRSTGSDDEPAVTSEPTREPGLGDPQ